MRRPDFDVFIDRFQPVHRPDEEGSYVYETYGSEYKKVLNHFYTLGEGYIFTIIEGSNDKLYACPGLHFVNRFGYILTTVPFKENERDYLW